MDALEQIAENKIREAISRGEFSDLPHAGLTVDLTEYFNSPPHLRLVNHILKNAGLAPREVELLREIKQLHREKSKVVSLVKQQKLKREIILKETELNIVLDHQKKTRFFKLTY